MTVTDANGCTSTECITVSVQDIPIYSAPSPPIATTISSERGASAMEN